MVVMVKGFDGLQPEVCPAGQSGKGEVIGGIACGGGIRQASCHLKRWKIGSFCHR
jgi:hypothetical protein